MIESIELLVGMTIEGLRKEKERHSISIQNPEFIGDEAYISIPGMGVSFVLEDGRTIHTIQLYPVGRDGFSEFRGHIPGGISFNTPRGLARVKLGASVAHSDGGVLPILGGIPAWDLFQLEGFYVHLEYTEDCRAITLISVSAVSA